MSLVEMGIVGGLVLHLLPVIAAFRVHRVGLVWVGTTLVALSSAAFVASLGSLVHLGPSVLAPPWAHLMTACGVPILLSGFFFSAVIGRANAAESLRGMSGTFAALLLFGVAALVFVREPAFVANYEWRAGAGHIQLGALGKAYLGYLLAGVVLVGRNLESTYRLARRDAQQRLQPLLLGSFGVLGFGVYVLSMGLWKGDLEVENLSATLVPLAVANVLVALGIGRGALVNATVPVSRNIVYSSLTAVAAAGYALVVGTAAQLAGVTGWSPGQVATVSFVFLVIFSGAAVFLSDNFQRRLRRFIDLNFYLDRYDYRTQWSRVSRTLDPTLGELGVLRAAEVLFRDVFLAEEVTVALRVAGGNTIRPMVGKGMNDPEAILDLNNPLCQRLLAERKTLLIDRKLQMADDIPSSAELDQWRARTAGQIVTPLLVGNDFLGLVGLERARHEDRFSFEDLDLMTNMAAQVASVLRSVQLGKELALAREMELLSQWSRMILHDLKNYLSPLRLIVQNMRVYIGNPEFQKDAVEDLASVATRMENLIKRLSDLRQGKLWAGEVVDLNEVTRETLGRLNLDHRRSLAVETDFKADLRVHGDGVMLQSVVENLVTNAVDAMDGKGTLMVRSHAEPRGGEAENYVLEVADQGPGMKPEFIRERLFRPFSTTKKGGWGLGLYQVRSIVEAHGGEILVESKPGEGTVFKVVLPGTRSDAPHPDFRIAASIPEAGRRTPWTR